MRQLKNIKRMLLLGARCGALGLALVAGTAFAADVAKPPADLFLKGDAKCTGCHDEADDSIPTMLDLHPSVLSIGKTRHGMTGDSRTPTCTSCHGNSDKHVNHKGSNKPPATDVIFGKKSKTPAKVQSETCLTCHAGGSNIHWDNGVHAANDVTCSSCHSVHRAKDKVRDKTQQVEVCYTCHKTQRAESFKASHHPMNEGKVVCSSCHSPHGSTGPKQLIKNTVNETCYTCHTEKRGPFLFEHPVASDNCLNCHNSHGSNNIAMLKTRQPYLCQQCHDFTRHPGNPYSGTGLPASAGGNAANNVGNSGAQQLLLRSCANCHTQVHGSNHPSGVVQTR